MKLKHISDISTWFNTIVTIVSLIASTGISYVYFRAHLLEIIITVQSVIIAYFLYRSVLTSLSEKAPYYNIKNCDIFNEFYIAEAKLVEQRKEQLNSGYLQLFSDEIERVQTNLINYVEKSNAPLIRATDITYRPDILVTRKKYLDRNRSFTRNGGQIQRILLIPDKCLSDQRYIKSLYDVIMENKKCNVDIGLLPFSVLNKKQIQDFIIYDEFSVLVEGLQADPKYSFGTSTLYFKASMYDEYDALFLELWNNTEINPKEMMLLFEDNIKIDGKLANFDYNNFMCQLKQRV